MFITYTPNCLFDDLHLCKSNIASTYLLQSTSCNQHCSYVIFRSISNTMRFLSEEPKRGILTFRYLSSILLDQQKNDDNNYFVAQI